MGHVIGSKDFPRRGSMQFWPRNRAKRPYPRIKNAPDLNEVNLSSFSGYKVGMTHIIVIDNKKNSPTKGQEIMVPVTIIECPSIHVFSARFYKKTPNGLQIISQNNSKTFSEDLQRRLNINTSNKSSSGLSKKRLLELAEEGVINKITVTVHTSPGMTSIGKKKPEIMEVIITGDVKEGVEKVFELLGKEVQVSDVLKEGEQLDAFAVTTGKGFQGSVKRFGVKTGRHKAEKVKRKAMTLGPWKPSKVNHRVPQHGQMGYQTRCDFNKWLMKIMEPDEVNVKGGFINYGKAKNTVLLVKGSVPGPKKRLIRLRKSIKPNSKYPNQVPELVSVSKSSKQGN